MKKVYIYSAALAVLLGAMPLHAQKRTQPKPGPSPAVNIANPESFTLSNGLKVLIVENHKLPRVSYNLTIDNPLVLEGDKAGVSSVLNAMLGNQTKQRSQDQFNEEIDFLGAVARFHSGGAMASGLSKSSQELFALMADGALHSVLTQEEFDKAKAKVLENIKANEKSVSSKAAMLGNALLFGKNSAVGEFATAESVQNITLKDVQDFYAKHFTPNNAYLVIVGDVDYKKTKTLVETLFGDWKSSKTQYPKTQEEPNVKQTQIDFIDMNNAVQSEITLMNQVDLKMNDKDYFAALLANQILGGGGEGRLFLNLREAHGWTYGAYSSLSTQRKYPGSFKASSSVRNVVTDSAVTEFIKEIELMRSTLVKKEELDMAKAKYVGGFVMDIQKPTTVASLALNKQLYGLSDDFYENYIKNINAVTPEQIQAVAKKYFLKDNMRIVVVGKASDVLTGLEGLGIPMKYYDTNANTTQRPEPAKELSTNSVQSVVDKYLAAIGGADNVQKVNSVYVIAEGTVQGMTLGMTTKIKKGYTLVEQSMMGNVMARQVATPEGGFAEMGGQKIVLEGKELLLLQQTAYPVVELSFIGDDEIKVVGVQEFNGKNAIGLQQGDLTHYYDVDSGLKVAIVTQTEVQGQNIVSTVLYGDYQEVSGVKFPFSMSTNVGVEVVLTVKSLKVNTDVTDQDFK